MRIRLKGINKVTRRLADGSVATYHYAWKGGPRLPGKPGDPEFVMAYHEAHKSRRKADTGTIADILRSYQESRAFLDLSEFSRRDYLRQLRKIEDDFAGFPVAALADRRARGDFLSWRDRLATKSRRQADYALTVLARVLSWALDRGLVPANPCARPGRTYRSGRAEIIWSEADETAFMQAAPPHLQLAFQLAIWTGQRQGDLLRLSWSSYDGQMIRLKQRKGGKAVVIPVAEPLKALLDVTPRKAVTILTTTRAAGEGTLKAWTQDGFRASWAKAVEAAGITGRTFHDLRGTAVTRLALAGCTTAEIAAITGHSLKDVGAILDAHYLSRDRGLAESAIRKRVQHEARTKIPK